MEKSAPSLARNEDPSTSYEAARRATRASKKAMQVVGDVMKDGVARTDEEIWHRCRVAGFLKSLSTVQHARLALVKHQRLVKTEARRPTKNGTPAQVWVKAPDADQAST